MIGRLSMCNYLIIVDQNQLPNFPVIRSYIMADKDIFESKLGSLKGKVVHRSGTAVTYSKKKKPPEIMEQYRELTIVMYTTFFEKLHFLMTIYHGIKFGTYEYLTNRKQETVPGQLNRVKHIYSRQVFSIDYFSEVL